MALLKPVLKFHYLLFTGLCLENVSKCTCITQVSTTLHALCPSFSLGSVDSAMAAAEQWVHSQGRAGLAEGKSCHHDGMGQGVAAEQVGWTV